MAAAHTSLPRPIGERQAVPFESAIGLENDVGRRVIGIGVHGVGAHLILRRGKSEIENGEIGDFHRRDSAT